MCSLTQTGRKGVSAKEHLAHKPIQKGRAVHLESLRMVVQKWEET